MTEKEERPKCGCGQYLDICCPPMVATKKGIGIDLDTMATLREKIKTLRRRIRILEEK